MLRRHIISFLMGLTTARLAVASAQAAVPQGAGAADASPEPLILQDNEGEHLVRNAGQLGGVPFIIKVDGDAGHSRDFFVFTDFLDPGRTIPFHRHDNSEELFLVSNGGVTITIGNRRALAGPRSLAYIPQGMWHSATNTGAHPAHVTAIYSRHGFEKYMRAIGARPGEKLRSVAPAQLTALRTLGGATYWDTKIGPYPPGVAHP